MTASIVSYEWTEYRERGKQKDREAPFQIGWTGDNGDPDNFLSLLGCAAIGMSNYAAWCNEEFEDLIQKAKTTRTRPSAPRSTKRRRSSSRREAPG